MADEETFRYTFTITPLTAAEMQSVIDDIRERFGRKPLIHVYGRQPSGTPLDQAPGFGVAASALAACEAEHYVPWPVDRSKPCVERGEHATHRDVDGRGWVNAST